MVLFPIAFVWLLVLMLWLARHSKNDIEPPREELRRWHPPRRPRPPRNGRPSRGRRERQRAQPSPSETSAG